MPKVILAVLTECTKMHRDDISLTNRRNYKCIFVLAASKGCHLMREGETSLRSLKSPQTTNPTVIETEKMLCSALRF